MAKRYTAAELTEKARIAKLKEDARAAARAASPKAYVPRKPENYSTIYYRDPFKSGQIYQIQVKAEALAKVSGAAGAGLLTALPNGESAIEITKGSKIVLVRLRWYFGDDTPVPVTKNYGGVTTRYIKKYDKSGNQSHYSLPYSVTTDSNSMLNTIQTRFEAQFNETDGTLREQVLGANGMAFLELGYGSKWTTLASL